MTASTARRLGRIVRLEQARRDPRQTELAPPASDRALCDRAQTGRIKRPGAEPPGPLFEPPEPELL